MHAACNLTLDSFVKISNIVDSSFSIEFLQRSFYSLLLAMTKDCTVPVTVLKLLDNTVDVNSMISAAQLEDFGSEGLDDYYGDE